MFRRSNCLISLDTPRLSDTLRLHATLKQFVSPSVGVTASLKRLDGLGRLYCIVNIAAGRRQLSEYRIHLLRNRKFWVHMLMN